MQIYLYLSIHEQISYNVKRKDSHKNGWIEPRKSAHGPVFMDNYYALLLYYETFDVEEQVESLVYDAGSLLVSVGGNLGLFLGLSCLSVIFAIINLLKNNWLQLKIN